MHACWGIDRGDSLLNGVDLSVTDLGGATWCDDKRCNEEFLVYELKCPQLILVAGILY